MTSDAHQALTPPPTAGDGDTAVLPAATTPEPAETVIGTAPVTVPVPPPQYPPSIEPVPAARTAAPEEDRPWVNLVWEGILLVVTGLGLAGWLLFGSFDRLPAVDLLLIGLAPFLILATAVGLSMRVGAVNLAVVVLAVNADQVYRTLDERGVPLAVLVVAGGAVAVGAIIAFLVTVCRSPGWAASLTVGLGLLVVSTAMRDQWDHGSGAVVISHTARWLIVGGVVLVSVAGGLLGMIPGVRRVLGACRAADDGHRRRGAAGAGLTWLALIGSSLLAAAAGVLGGMITGTAAIMPGDLDPQLVLALVLGIVLIGGTGLRGRRGGPAGTVLGWLLVAGVLVWISTLGTDHVVVTALPVVVLLLGLVVNGVLNRVSRPKAVSRVAVPPRPVGLPPNMVSAGELVPGFGATEPPAQPGWPTTPPAEQPALVAPTPVPVVPTPMPVAQPAVPTPAPEPEPPAAVSPPPMPVSAPPEPAPVTEAVSPEPAPVEPVSPAAAEPSRPGSVISSETPDATPPSTPPEANPYLYRPPAG